MRLLLDTVTFIWLTSEPAKLSTPATDAMNDAGNDLGFSHASIWEHSLTILSPTRSSKRTAQA